MAGMGGVVLLLSHSVLWWVLFICCVVVAAVCPKQAIGVSPRGNSADLPIAKSLHNITKSSSLFHLHLAPSFRFNPPAIPWSYVITLLYFYYFIITSAGGPPPL
jgi:ABC-type transport system involved in cytochrome c biogenesis permease subunit